MDLGDPLKIVVRYLLLERMVGFVHRDGFHMASALVCMVTH